MHSFLKFSVAPLLCMTVFLSSSRCRALDRPVARCTTADGRYQVVVQENDGGAGGLVRPPRFLATVSDTKNDEIVANYFLNLKLEDSDGLGPVHDGGIRYLDLETEGLDFDLAEPSVHANPITLTVKLQSGAHRGETVADNGMHCDIF